MSSLLLTAGLCLVIFLLSLRRPQWGLLVIAALVPFHGLLIIAPVVGSFWKEAAVLAVAAAGLFVARPRQRVAVLPWLPVALVLVVFGAVSAVVTLGSGAGFPVKIAFFYLLPVVIVYFFPFTRVDKDRLVSLLLLTGVICACYGLAQQLIGGWALSDLGYEWNEHIRSAGPLLRSFSSFNQPFPFGFYMMLVLVLGGAAALAEPGRWRSRLFWCVSPILLLAMLSSVVRAAIIGLLAAVVVLGALRYRWLLWLLACGVGLGILLIPLALVVDQRGVVATMLSPDSLEDRGGHWSQMGPQMLLHPFGEGLGTTGSAAQRVGSLSGTLGGVYQPDNQYIKVGLELGLFGLALYGLVLGLALVVLWRLVRIQRDSFEQSFTVGVLAVTVAAAVAGLFSTYLEIFPLDFFFWLLLAAAASVPRAEAVRIGGWRRPPPGSPRRREAYRRPAAPTPTSPDRGV